MISFLISFHSFIYIIFIKKEDKYFFFWTFKKNLLLFKILLKEKQLILSYKPIIHLEFSLFINVKYKWISLNNLNNLEYKKEKYFVLII